MLPLHTLLVPNLEALGSALLHPIYRLTLCNSRRLGTAQQNPILTKDNSMNRISASQTGTPNTRKIIGKSLLHASAIFAVSGKPFKVASNIFFALRTNPSF
jgi:hypothetical protein